MNAYRFSYEGMWLGGTMIVIAPNKEIAEKLAKEKISESVDKRFVKDKLKSLELEEEMSIVEPTVVFDYNGDY